MFQQFYNFFYAKVISTQFWVAICFTLLCCFFQIVNGWENVSVLIISFTATLFSYNLAHWISKKSEKWRLIIMAISLAICCYFAFVNLSTLTLSILTLLGIISVLYSVPFKNKNLRNIPFLKMLWIALVWSISVVLPWFESFYTEWWIICLQVLSTFCFVVAITIPFDIRDLENDNKKMETIPQVMGFERSIQLGYQLLMFSFLLFFASQNFEINHFVLAFLISVLAAFYALKNTKTKQNIWYSAFWVEGISLLPLIIYYVVTMV